MAAQGTKFCKHCGGTIDNDCVVCPLCGKQVEELKSNSSGNIVINNNNNNNNNNTVAGGVFTGELISPKSWLVTLLLCLFLGGIGIHRFYVGKIGTGILMLILAFTGISFIWCLIDLVMIIVSKFTDSQGRPIKR